MSKKRIIATFLTAVMVICGIAVVPKEAKAAIPEDVYYECDIDITKYWSKDEKKVPVCETEGYFFGGWFQENADGTHTVLKEAYLEEVDLSELKNVCAKFVPSYLFSVKAQIEKEAESSNGNKDTTYLRLITGLDSNEYQKVNFDVYYNNREDLHAVSPDITKLHDSILNDDGNLQPETTFGEAAHVFAVVRLTQIKQYNYNKIIYARPYVTTMDGTQVWGNAKYVRVEDGFDSNEYISVAVNLQEGGDMAAGSLALLYDQTTLNVFDVTTGRLLDEVDSKVNTETGIIKFVGNATIGDDSTYSDVKPDGLYVNVRFKKKSAAELEQAGITEIPAHWSFEAIEETFCNWDEKLVDVKAWDIRY